MIETQSFVGCNLFSKFIKTVGYANCTNLCRISVGIFYFTVTVIQYAAEYKKSQKLTQNILFLIHNATTHNKAQMKQYCSAQNYANMVQLSV